MNIVIESATMNDYDAVNLIVNEGQEEHAEALPDFFKKVDKAMPQSYFREVLEDPKSKILIAKATEEIVGFAVMELKESPPFDSLVRREFVYLNDFGIKNNYHRNGIGKVLFDACVVWTKRNEATSIELNVWEFNKKAIAFYENYGMESLSRKMILRF